MGPISFIICKLWKLNLLGWVGVSPLLVHAWFQTILAIFYMSPSTKHLKYVQKQYFFTIPLNVYNSPVNKQLQN